MPEPAAATRHIRSDGREFEDAEYRSLADYERTHEVKMVRVISDVIARRMASAKGED